MDSLVEKLEVFGLDKFIIENQHELCRWTVNQNKVASFLHFDFDLGALIEHPPDSFSKCMKLYELIQRTCQSKVKYFLEALDKTGNEHIIEFIIKTISANSNSNRSQSQSRGIWFNIPEPIESFYGRDDFLTQLHDQLKPRVDSETEVTVLSQVKIVTGLGGIGKTETARKYIMNHQKFYNNFIWINAETQNSITNSFTKIAEELKIPIKDPNGKSRAIDKIVKEIYDKICEGEKSTLFVFDNAEDYQSCQKFLPFGLHPDLKKPVILATSRNQEWRSDTGKIRILPLDVLTESESLEFILKELELEIPESEIPEFKGESKEFIQLIGGLPLALQQAVAYIRQEKELRELGGTRYKISDYVQEFKSSMEKFLTFPPISTGSSPTVFVTWNVTFEKIQGLENGPEAVKILEILSFLYADKIPSTFLHDLVPYLEGGKFSGALKLLKKYSLIKNNSKEFYLSIHRQLQFVILQYLKECEDVSKVVMDLVIRCTGILQDIKVSKSADVILNVHQIVTTQLNLPPVPETFLNFMYKFGTVLWKASRYSESLDIYTKVYSQRILKLGENHKNTLTAQHEMALQLLHLGKYEESLVLYRKLLGKIENHPDFGVNHLTLSTKHNIASILQTQKKYREALELNEQILAQHVKIQAERDKHRLTNSPNYHPPWILSTENSIALIHSELGDFSKSLSLLEGVQKKREDILGPDHSDVLSTKHSKACVLFRMGRFQEACTIFNHVWEKQKQVLGEHHLDTVATLGWIAATLEDQGKFEEALNLCRKVYEIRKKDLGENHPQTINMNTRIRHLERTIQEKK